MFVIDTNKEDVLKDFPFIVEWLSSAEKITQKPLDESKIEFYYSYGFFLPKVENKEDFYSKMYDDISKMKYPERLLFEMSKVRVDLTMKMGNFVLSNRLEKGSIPEIIRMIVTELTKVKMTIECEYYDNIEIKDSIPDIDTDIVSFEIIRDVVKDDYQSHFNVDEILDKISTSGMESLSDEEKEFLDKKSKGL